jgi:hypothetical protein
LILDLLTGRMSDADDSGFDKEAERERLREKYERDQADREAAQQMSDLLLKGATMTNSHCEQCGSPIFRVDGQEFCPSCNVEGEAAADADGAAAEVTDADGAPQGSGEAATGDTSPDQRLADVVSSGEDDAEPDATAGTSIAERAAASVQSGGREAPSEATDDTVQRDAGPSTPSRQSSGQPSGSTPQQAGGTNASLADAQQSLLNAIAHHARAATGAEPRTARDHLEAAGEAAEALAEISPED